MCEQSNFKELYSNKIILAPMVKAGRTPLRLQTLKYGADLVYTEEIVDQKLLKSKRIENDILGTVDFAVEDGIVLRIDKVKEKEKCILQIGTCNAERAVQVLDFVCDDVGGIDVNMGCPKPFSISGGMGAALLSKPELANEILTSLVKRSKIPVSCKIRVLNNREKTLEFVKLVERTGIAAVSVHGRRKDERPQHSNRVEEIREIAKYLQIPVIANGSSGEIKKYEDIEKFRQDSASSGVMLARRALSNPSIFRSDGLLGMDEEIQDFLKLVCEYEEGFTTTKYVVQRILQGKQETDPRGRATLAAADNLEICRAWSLEDVYWSFHNQSKIRKRVHETDDSDKITHIDLTFSPKRLKDQHGAATPKCILNAWCDESGIQRPSYDCQLRTIDKRFIATINVNGSKFLSRIGQPNKKMAEQVAALAALVGLNQRDKLNGNWE